MSFFQQDYVMRQIQLMIRAILKIFFRMDLDTPGVKREISLRMDDPQSEIFHLFHAGRINEAETRLFELANPKNREHLKEGLLFYDALNQKSDEFLEAREFSREEIKSGVQDLLEIYGLRSFTD